MKHGIANRIFLLGEFCEDATNWVGEVAVGCIKRLFRDNLSRGWNKFLPICLDSVVESAVGKGRDT